MLLLLHIHTIIHLQIHTITFTNTNGRNEYSWRASTHETPNQIQLSPSQQRMKWIFVITTAEPQQWLSKRDQDETTCSVPSLVRTFSISLCSTGRVWQSPNSGGTSDHSGFPDGSQDFHKTSQPGCRRNCLKLFKCRNCSGKAKK